MFIPALDQSTPHVHAAAGGTTNTKLGNIHLAWIVSQHIATNTKLGNIHLAWIVKQHIFPATWTESGRSGCSGGSSPHTLTYGSSVAENVAVGAVLSVEDQDTFMATWTYTVTSISADGTQVTMNYTSDGGTGMGDMSPCAMTSGMSQVAGTYTNP